MKFIDYVLRKPSYGWKNEAGELIVPTGKTLFREALSRINIFRDRRNWISVQSCIMIGLLSPFLFLFVTRYFSWPLLIVFALYTMIVMGTHGTIWFHRYCTHRSYTFSHPVWRFLTQHLVIKTLPEEIYVVSHHVHHSKADQPGDPYNARGGFLYCMFAEFNHQSISRELSETDYTRAAGFLRHTGVMRNSYNQYRNWGSITNPLYSMISWISNWIFWFTILFLIGGAGLACAVFSSAMLWFIFIRAFNYTGHGQGKVKHKDGSDYDRSNLAINQARPGLFTGEWHNNHHLYPGSARAGFLPYQLDLAWIYIFCMHKIGAVSSYKDSKKEFLRRYHHHGGN